MPAISRIGAAPRAAVSVSNARAEASRKNGAKSRGLKTPEGKARSAQNALRHGLRAEKYVVLPQEDAAEFAGLEAALIEELAPVGALQTVLARRVAVAAWRLTRADRIESELFAERGYGGAGAGLALIRDGNGTRSFETLLRYRAAAMAEFWRALKTLKALQAEQAQLVAGTDVLMTPSSGPQAPAPGQAARTGRTRAPPDRRLCHARATPGPATPCTSPPRAGCRTNLLRPVGIGTELRRHARCTRTRRLRQTNRPLLRLRDNDPDEDRAGDLVAPGSSLRARRR
jgi:hypothetical protein